MSKILDSKILSTVYKIGLFEHMPEHEKPKILEIPKLQIKKERRYEVFHLRARAIDVRTRGVQTTIVQAMGVQA